MNEYQYIECDSCDSLFERIRDAFEITTCPSCLQKEKEQKEIKDNG